MQSRTTKPSLSNDLINVALIKAHFIAGFVAFSVAIWMGFFVSMQFLRHHLFPGVEWLQPGRMRMTHTNLVAYGFIVNSFIGGMYYVIPKLTGQKILSDKLGWFIFWAWQAIVAATYVGLLMGQAQAIEWGETPIWIDPFVVVGVALLIVNLYTPILRSKERAFYVSIWYFIAALVWTALNYIMGNYLPQFVVPGTGGAAITSAFIHNLVGLFVTPVGVGLMYYFLPATVKKPVYSHALSLIGFWGLAFFYPQNTVHHYLFSPIPMYVQYAAVVASVGVHVVVYTVIYNFFATMKGCGGMMSENITLRWIVSGSLAYLFTCIQCAIQVTLAAQQIIHFTDWVVGHAHLVMFGTFGFWIMAMLTYLWPRFYGREFYSRKLNEWHFWLFNIGMWGMWIDLLAAGMVQGYVWKSLMPWEHSIDASMSFWITRTIFGIMILTGATLFTYNLWKTAKLAKAESTVKGGAAVTATATP